MCEYLGYILNALDKQYDEQDVRKTYSHFDYQIVVVHLIMFHNVFH